MTSTRLHPVADLLAVLSGSATITAWQTQLDWTLRVLAAIVAIIAGVVTIWQRLKKKPERE